jgi:hypothetical protein
MFQQNFIVGWNVPEIIVGRVGCGIGNVYLPLLEYQALVPTKAHSLDRRDSPRRGYGKIDSISRRQGVDTSVVFPCEKH